MANQNNYLRRQLGDSLRQKRREIRSSSSSRPPDSVQEEEAEGEDDGVPHSGGSSSEGDSPRYPRRGRRQAPNSNDFKVDIPEFEGKLNPDDFVEWLQTAEKDFRVQGDCG